MMCETPFVFPVFTRVLKGTFGLADDVESMNDAEATRAQVARTRVSVVGRNILESAVVRGAPRLEERAVVVTI
jgi:hypothetical protein